MTEIPRPITMTVLAALLSMPLIANADSSSTGSETTTSTDEHMVTDEQMMMDNQQVAFSGNVLLFRVC